MPLQAEKFQSAQARFTSLQQTEPSATVSDLYGRQSGKCDVLMASEINAPRRLLCREMRFTASRHVGTTCSVKSKPRLLTAPCFYIESVRRMPSA